MGFEVRVGTADLTSVRRALKQVGDVGLGKQLARGLSRAARPLGPAIRAEVPRAMPSGYAPVLSKSLRFRTAVNSTKQTARLVFRVYGDGRREKRDVPTLNRGVLRHPVYGKRGAGWVAQRVRSGFVDRPADRMGPDISREMQGVVDYVADQITKG